MNTDEWVEGRMNQLNLAEDWHPDTNRALLQFHERHARDASRSSQNVRLTCVALAACVCVVAVMEFRGVSASDRIFKRSATRSGLRIAGFTWSGDSTFLLQTQSCVGEFLGDLVRRVPEGNSLVDRVREEIPTSRFHCDWRFYG